MTYTESIKSSPAGLVRTFSTGATRDTDSGKIDPEGFLNPLAVKTYCEYMHKHRKQSDGTLRESDNWQKGMPKDEYIKSHQRHALDWWLEHRGYESRDGMVDAICGVIFNAFGYLTEVLKESSTPSPRT